ncbi:MAG: hypothetical protein ABW043_13000 [Devosia sp.]
MGDLLAHEKPDFALNPEAVDEKPGYRPLFGSVSLDFFGVNAD